MKTRPDDYVELIRSITSCRQRASLLGHDFLADLLAMAAMEAALQWNGGHSVLSNANTRLEEMLRLKLTMALGQSDADIVPIISNRQKTRDQ
jgi:hypothetical protein